MLAGAMETVSGTEDSASSLTSTSGGLASTLAASGLGPVICHIFASPNNWTPFTCKLSDCGSSVGLTIAIVRNLRSLLNAAETSNGYVGLPRLVAGCSPPTGHLGADCGEGMSGGHVLRTARGGSSDGVEMMLTDVELEARVATRVPVLGRPVECSPTF